MARAFRRPHEAAQLHGSLVAALDALAGDMPPAHRQGYEVQVRKLERDLGSEVFARQLALGQPLQWPTRLGLAIPTPQPLTQPCTLLVSTPPPPPQPSPP